MQTVSWLCFSSHLLFLSLLPVAVVTLFIDEEDPSHLPHLPRSLSLSFYFLSQCCYQPTHTLSNPAWLLSTEPSTLTHTHTHSASHLFAHSHQIVLSWYVWYKTQMKNRHIYTPIQPINVSSHTTHTHSCCTVLTFRLFYQHRHTHSVHPAVRHTYTYILPALVFPWHTPHTHTHTTHTHIHTHTVSLSALTPVWLPPTHQHYKLPGSVVLLYSAARDQRRWWGHAHSLNS